MRNSIGEITIRIKIRFWGAFSFSANHEITSLKIPNRGYPTYDSIASIQWNSECRNIDDPRET